MSAGRKRIVRRHKRKATAWQRSDRFRQIGSAAITAYNQMRDERPKCRATAKSTGERCGQSAMANGVCYYHGGRTPSGEGWHKPAWPNADAPDVEAKLDRKLRNREQASKKRARRLSQMSPDERQHHDEWQRTHKPGAAGARAYARAMRQQGGAAKLLGETGTRPPTDDKVALQQAIDALEAKAKRLSRQFDIFG